MMDENQFAIVVSLGAKEGQRQRGTGGGGLPHGPAIAAGSPMSFFP